jgi:hypothetical protein
MTGTRIPGVCGATVLAAAFALASTGCAATSSSTAPAAPPSSASRPASATAAAVSASAAATASASPAAPATAATSSTATAAATGAFTPATGTTTASACSTFASGHTFLHLTRATENADGTLTVAGVAATMVCGGPDDFHYDFGTAAVTGHVLARATIQVLGSTLQPTPIKLGKFPSYLASDMNVRVFTYTGPRTAITALTEQFHP